MMDEIRCLSPDRPDKNFRKKHCFVILGHPRSGTTWLADLLDAHQEASCMYEPFHRSWQSRRKEHRRFWSDEDFFRHGNDYGHAGRGTYKVRSHYIRDKIWTIPDLVVGFKDHVGNLKTHPRYANYLAGLGSHLRTIWVKRNPLRTFLSMHHARKLNQWNVRESVGEPIHRNKVSLSPRKALEHVRYSEESDAVLLECCDSVLMVEYESLYIHHRGTMQDILNFLQLPNASLHSDYMKLQTGDFRSLVSNWQEIEAYFPSDKKHYFDGEIV
jgi:hypothetical protein